MRRNSACRDSQQVQSLVESVNQFALWLFEQVSNDRPKSNLVFSPSSIASVLAMARLGASGKTRECFDFVLEHKLSEVELGEAYRVLMDEIAASSSDLCIANRVWGDARFGYHDKFQADLLDLFHADLERVDFANESESAVGKINAWVRKQTDHRIDRIVDSGSISSATTMLLTNAVSFNGSWLLPFDRKETKTRPFHLSDGTTTSVKMMSQREHLGIAGTADYMVLQLPYRDTSQVEQADGQPRCRFVMQIVLPRHPSFTLDRAMDWVVAGGINELQFSYASEVKVSLPRFRIENTLSLESALKTLGLSLAMDPARADYSNMCEQETGMSLSKLTQRAMVEVDEEGTVASAATGAWLTVGRSATFCVDRPFLFQIIDRQTKLIHFLGRCERP
ncbi:serpin family protein [Aeoliella mucimassa]|uniref:Serpin (Serine protease inhibitor) n=1 Tax=Aeoliella mucimassa TaxID=2527972 RepID=A0A518ARQ5_9BACT|nr:serpin family protein [Aeoliella mucimassa]QDU57388.1 Serpin (serine protease inhibitor) [Aeoliella mucimassa]